MNTPSLSDLLCGYLTAKAPTGKAAVVAFGLDKIQWPNEEECAALAGVQSKRAMEAAALIVLVNTVTEAKAAAIKFTRLGAVDVTAFRNKLTGWEAV